MFDLIIGSDGLFAYVIVLVALLAGSVGIPAPEDLTLIAAGILCSLSQVNMWVMGLTCYLGLIIGDLIIYRIGWMAGPTLFRKKWFRKHISTSRLQAMRTNLHKRTMLTILIARHLFYIRTATFLMCGAVRISFSRFLVMDAIAALITTPLMMGLGYVFAHNYQVIIRWMRDLKYVLVGIGLIAAIFIYRHYKRGKAEAESDFADCIDKSDDNKGDTVEGA
jgi:membrane protein DedA with SNARE-associated domain